MVGIGDDHLSLLHITARASIMISEYYSFSLLYIISSIRPVRSWAVLLIDIFPL